MFLIIGGNHFSITGIDCYIPTTQLGFNGLATLVPGISFPSLSTQ